MGYVLDHGGMMGALALTVGSMLLTALLTLPFLRSPAARDDDEAFVKRLCADLVEQGMRVWWDRMAMQSRGRTFLQEICDAISAAGASFTHNSFRQDLPGIWCQQTRQARQVGPGDDHAS